MAAGKLHGIDLGAAEATGSADLESEITQTISIRITKASFVVKINFSALGLQFQASLHIAHLSACIAQSGRYACSCIIFLEVGFNWIIGIGYVIIRAGRGGFIIDDKGFSWRTMSARRRFAPDIP